MADSKTNGAVVILLDEKYTLPCFVLMQRLYPMIRAEGLDIVVLTASDTIANNPTIMAECKVVRIKHRFEDVNQDRALSNEFNSTYAENVFAKFEAFSDFGYEFHIFFDVDMVVNRPFSLTELVPDAWFACSPTQGAKAIGAGTGISKQKMQTRALKLMRADWGTDRSMNSGLMVITKPLLSTTTVNELYAYSGMRPFKTDQDAIQHLADEKDWVFRSLSSKYNFNMATIREVGPTRYAKYLEPELKVLHFVGFEKPWITNKPMKYWHNRIWWNAHAEVIIADYKGDWTNPFFRAHKQIHA